MATDEAQPNGASTVKFNPEVVSNGHEGAHAPDQVQAPPPEKTISEEEIALYDRQIRLWGVEAQEKLRVSSVLLISCQALAAEAAKNIVLAGIGSLTIADDELVSEDDLGAQFLLSETDVGQNRAEATARALRKLNPRVQIHAYTHDIITQPPEFYTSFHLVIATDLPLSTLSHINSCCRVATRPLYAGASHGMYGFLFADLIQHQFVIRRDKSNVPTLVGNESKTRSVISSLTKKEDGKVIELVKKLEIYSPISLANTSPLPREYRNSRRKLLQVPPLLSGLRALWEFEAQMGGKHPSEAHAEIALFTTLATEKHKELQLPQETLTSSFMRNFLQNIDCELAPVTAVLGGVLAQDVINVLGGKEQPLQNFLLFDGEDTKGPVYALHPDLTAEDTILPTAVALNALA